MDNFINGQGIERSINKAATAFIEASTMNMETLRIKAVVRDASMFKFILHKPDGNLYHNTSGEMLGKNQADCIEFFKNPMNAKLWETLVDEVEVHW